jgi:6-pyruvoyltetrahydropterin/6-carboxytetrahydropterin synthase
MATETYRVRIQKERLVFSAAHFITYGGDICEPIHGHNYHVYCEVEGPLDHNRYVIDFIALRDALQKIVDGLDHRVILPLRHPTIKVVEQPGGEKGEVVATHGQRRWVFPRQDCVLLDVENTTAELLAKHIADATLASLDPAVRSALVSVELGVDECDGQWGVYRWRHGN